MRSPLIVWLVSLLLSVAIAGCGGGGGEAATAAAPPPVNTVPPPPTNTAPTLLITSNASGSEATFSRGGSIDQTNPFFKPFGNGRSCASCHQPTDGWTITPSKVLARFNQTGGQDPLFLIHDGANSPQADTSTIAARRAAYSMLLSKGLIRMGLPMPPNAEFDLVQVDDPYGFASSGQLSLFRRPRPSTNLTLSAAVMWDGRETHKDPTSSLCIAGTSDCFRSLDFNLGSQANGAVVGHAQAIVNLTPAEQSAIVDFEKALFTTQIFDVNAKSLTGAGGKGGPLALSGTDYYFGINDLIAGDYRTRAPFTSTAMNLFDAWNTTSGSLADPDTPPSDVAAVTAARQAVARGQTIFNGRQFVINNVRGMPGPLVTGTCATCHNAPNVGGNSVPLLFDIGVSDAANRTPDMPLYTLRNRVTGATIQTTDPGAALISGKWDDVGRFKVPVLRGMASRPPYFHDGTGRDLTDVVNFYNVRFNMGLTAAEISDLAAFMGAL
jgi:cytochrome c peroxidase